MIKAILKLIPVILLLMNFACSEKSDSICVPHMVDICSCPDGKTGLLSCEADGRSWTQCSCSITGSEKDFGEQSDETDAGSEVRKEKRKQKEVISECHHGQTRQCYTGTTGCWLEDNRYKCHGSCRWGSQTCIQGTWSKCNGEVLPSKETKDGNDDDCDGKVDNSFLTISAGTGYLCAIQKDKTLRCQGVQSNGYLANGTRIQNYPLDVLKNVKQVSTGPFSLCVLLEDTTVRCWGDNKYGQLGTGKMETEVKKPTPVKGLQKVTQVSVGFFHACGVIGNGTIYCWGDNKYGQLGNGSTQNSTIPTQVKGINDAIAVSVSSGAFTCSLHRDSTVRCWGFGKGGAMGNGTRANSSLPVKLHFSKKVKKITTGSFHACALLEDSTVQCWGLNKFGSIGVGTSKITTIPTTVQQLKDVIQIEAGEYATCALTNSGIVKCWGSNQYKILGSHKTNQLFPLKLNQVNKVKQLSFRSDFICTIVEGGKILCWGAKNPNPHQATFP